MLSEVKLLPNRTYNNVKVEDHVMPIYEGKIFEGHMWSGASRKGGSSKGLHFAAINNNINSNDHSCLAIASQTSETRGQKQQLTTNIRFKLKKYYSNSGLIKILSTPLTPSHRVVDPYKNKIQNDIGICFRSLTHFAARRSHRCLCRACAYTYMHMHIYVIIFNFFYIS